MSYTSYAAVKESPPHSLLSVSSTVSLVKSLKGGREEAAISVSPKENSATRGPTAASFSSPPKEVVAFPNQLRSGLSFSLPSYEKSFFPFSSLSYRKLRKKTILFLTVPR